MDISSEGDLTESQSRAPTTIDPYNDFILDRNSFTVNIELISEFSSIEVEPEVELGFKGIGGSFLPPWIVKPGEKFRYVMPALIDDANIDISVKAARPDS